jgi:hypothetical protein
MSTKIIIFLVLVFDLASCSLPIKGKDAFMAEAPYRKESNFSCNYQAMAKCLAEHPERPYVSNIAGDMTYVDNYSDLGISEYPVRGWQILYGFGDFQEAG